MLEVRIRFVLYCVRDNEGNPIDWKEYDIEDKINTYLSIVRFTSLSDVINQTRCIAKDAGAPNMFSSWWTGNNGEIMTPDGYFELRCE